MALFKTSFFNHVTKLANKRTQYLNINGTNSEFSQEICEFSSAGTPDEDIDLVAMEIRLILESAPACVREVVIGIMEGRIQLETNLIDGIRRTTNDVLCELCGLDGINIRGNLRKLMRGNGNVVWSM